MSEENGQDRVVAAALQDLGSTRDYGEYVACFNSGRFYEAHDALEPLWLKVRHYTEGPLLKGLIQLAGAFVHVQRGRIGPAQALLARARYHLAPFSTADARLGVGAVLELIGEWEGRLASANAGDQLLADYRQPTLPHQSRT
jgi:hypothetical protein